MKSHLKSLIDFYKKPDLNPDQSFNENTFVNKIFQIASLWSFTIVLMYLTVPFLLYFSKTFGYEGENLNSELGSLPFFQGILLAGVFIPIIEEVCTRLYLSKQPAVISAGVVCLILFIIAFITPLFVDQENIDSVLNASISLLIVLAIFVFTIVFIPLYWILKNFFSKVTDSSFEKYSKIMIYFSVLIFGFAHIGNWAGYGDNLLLLPVLVIPQIIAGIFLVYIRVKFGFFFAIFAHAFNNSLIFIVIYLSLKGGGISWQSLLISMIYLVVVIFAVSECVKFFKNRRV